MMGVRRWPLPKLPCEEWRRRLSSQIVFEIVLVSNTIDGRPKGPTAAILCHFPPDIWHGPLVSAKRFS